MNSKRGFSGNFLKFLILPCVVFVLALVFAFVFGYNKGMDYKGGIEISVMADGNYNNDAEKYNEFKNTVAEIVEDNDVSVSAYIKELDSSTYNTVLVIKGTYAGEDVDTVVANLKSDLVAVFYSERNEAEIDNLHLVTVSTFGGFVSSWQILSAVLASLVMAIFVCIYLGFRTGVYSAFFGFVLAVFADLLTYALIMVTRVKINAYTIAIVPFATLFTLILAFIFVRRTKRLLATDQKYEKQSNFELANDAVMHNIKKKNFYGYLTLILALGFALCNVGNELINFGLAIFESFIVIYYTYMFVMPGFFALTFVRKVGKKQNNKSVNTNEKKLTQEEVFKETDLDNLTTN